MYENNKMCAMRKKRPRVIALGLSAPTHFADIGK